MSKRAEQAAMKAYPSWVEIVSDVRGQQEDLHGFARECYQEGYEQAEKDLSLTWEDVRMIVLLADSTFDMYTDIGHSKQYYEEVLRRFNEGKEEE